MSDSTPASPNPRKRRGVLLLVLFALVLSAFAWWPAWWAYPNTQGGDGPVFHKMLEAAKWSILRYHEFPGWNPYECGGLPLWDNPQAFIGAPLAWLTFLVGTTRTIELWYVIHSAAGFLGMWALLRLDLRLSRAACLVGSTMWAFNGFHQQHSGGGHVAFVPFEYFPFALFLWRRAERDVRYAVGLGVLVAWMMYEGAVYPLPHLVLILAIESAMRVWPARRALAIARAGAIVGVVGFGLAASRLIPVMHQLHVHNRGLPAEHDHLLWSTLRRMFTSRTHDRKLAGQDYVWPEFGAYVGPFLLFLSLLGILSLEADQLWLAGLWAISILFMLGHFSRWAPWHLLKAHVFPFKEMRVPSRFAAEVTLFLSAFAATAIDQFPRVVSNIRGVGRKVSPGRIRGAMLAFALLGLGDMIGVGLSWFPECFSVEHKDERPPSPHIYYGGDGLAPFIEQPKQNRGRLECWDEWGFGAGAPLWNDDQPQARAADTDVATVKAVRRTQNRFKFRVEAKAPTRVLLNSTYDDNWHSTVGNVVEVNKALAVDVPAGLNVVYLSYRPYGLVAGLVVSGVSLVVVVVWFFWDRQRRSAKRDSEAVALLL